MRLVRLRAAVQIDLLVRASAVSLSVVAAIVAPLGAQVRAPMVNSTAPLIARAIDHENAGRYDQARAGWLEVVQAGAIAQGVLGLERVYTMTGDEARLVPLLDSLVPLMPADAQLRGVQLRTLVVIGRDAQADSAFRAWRAQRPQDVAPYRDYARILLYNSRPAAADSILQEASVALGATRELMLEAAQMRAALGRWKDAADAWRETMRDQAYYETAAVFSLGPAPVDERDAIRGALLSNQPTIGSRHALALLELGWGAPLAGWQVLKDLPPSDTVVHAWSNYAEEAERVQAWSAARDALVAVHRAKPSPTVAERGATAALRSNDSETALLLARAARSPGESPRYEIVSIELEALARLGRGEEAERTLAAVAPQIGTRARGFARTIAWAWIRAGDIPRARAALVDATLDADDAVSGWLALYDGDLVSARRALRFGDVAAPEAVQALALLTRTRAERSATVGNAFLALARADSGAAVAQFVRAADELSDAAPLLVAMAARIETTRGADARALPLWTRVAEAYTSAPEAAEARLEWGRLLKRRGDLPAARNQFETLILSYPSSALVPQARRELAALPPTRAENE